MLKTTKIPRLIYSSRNCSRIEYRTAKSTPTNVVAKSAKRRGTVKAEPPHQTEETRANATIENRNLFARTSAKASRYFGTRRSATIEYNSNQNSHIVGEPFVVAC